jgi:hypothetical protein
VEHARLGVGTEAEVCMGRLPAHRRWFGLCRIRIGECRPGERPLPGAVRTNSFGTAATPYHIRALILIAASYQPPISADLPCNLHEIGRRSPPGSTCLWQAEGRELMRSRTRLILLGAIATLVLAIGAGTSSAGVSSLTIDPKATLSADRTQATVTGTIVCDAGDSVDMFANITETVGRLQRFARNLTLNTITCTGAVQPWSVTVTDLSTLPLLPGPANVGAFALENFVQQAQVLSQVLLVP